MLLPYKTKEGKQISIAGVLAGNLVEKFNCVGFEETVCTSSAAQNSIAGYRNCSSQYRGRWRRACAIVDGFYKKGTSILNSPEDPIFDEEMQMWRIGLSGYYEGTPEFPTYSLDCGKPGTVWASGQLKPRCRSAVHINDNLYIYYTFPQREGFWDHREINAMVEEKVKSFIVKE